MSGRTAQPRASRGASTPDACHLAVLWPRVSSATGLGRLVTREKPWTLSLPSAPLPFTNPASPQSLCGLVARSVFFTVDVTYNHIQNVPLQKIRRAGSRPKPSRSQRGSPTSSLVTEVVARSRASSKAKIGSSGLRAWPGHVFIRLS